METYFAAGFSALASILFSIAVWQFRQFGKTQTDHGQKLVRIETVLTGANGDNGLNGEVKQLKEWRQDQEEHGVPRRLDALERRYGLDDRRVHG